MIRYKILEDDLVAGEQLALDPGRSTAVFATLLEERLTELGYEVCGEIIPQTSGNIQNSGISFSVSEDEDEDRIWEIVNDLLGSDEWGEEVA